MELIRLVGKGLGHGHAFGSQLHHPLRQSHSARCPKDIARTGAVLPMRLALPNQPRPDLVVLPLPLRDPLRQQLRPRVETSGLVVDPSQGGLGNGIRTIALSAELCPPLLDACCGRRLQRDSRLGEPCRFERLRRR